MDRGLDAPSYEVGGFMVCWIGMTLALAPVPEPATAAMLLEGLGLTGTAMQRHQARHRTWMHAAKRHDA